MKKPQSLVRNKNAMLFVVLVLFIVPTLSNIGLSKAAGMAGIDTIELQSNYTLDSDLTFNGDGFIIKKDNIKLDLNNHTITGMGDGFGIIVDGRTGVTVERGKIENFKLGIKLHESRKITLSGNAVIENQEEGINLENTFDNTLSGNSALGNGIGFKLERTHDNTLSGNSALDNTISGFDLTDSEGNTLSGNSALNNGIGFSLYGSHDNMLSGNSALDNKGAGFSLRGSYDNVISGNTASQNSGAGFSLDDADRNNFGGCTAADNQEIGFSLLESNNNIFTGCTATMNDDYGIYLSRSNGNTIHNGIFNNVHNAYDDGTNTWYSNKTIGTYEGGNYWSDYTGEDADGDGFGETPYDISGGANQDLMPLMEPGGGAGTGEGGYIPGFTIEIGLLTGIVLMIWRKWSMKSRI